MDDREFDDFYRTRFSSLVRAIYLATGDHGRAEEYVQEAFVRAWMKRRQLESQDPVRWVERVAWRLAVSNWRSRRSLSRALERHGAGVIAYERPTAEILDARQHLELLPSDQQAVVVLHYFEGLAVAEIADVLDLPEGTVKSRLYRARERLRWALSDIDEGVGYEPK